MTYSEAKDFRGQILDRIFQSTSLIEDYVRQHWQKENCLPSNDEIKFACNQIYLKTISAAKPAFNEHEDLYNVFKKECEEIRDRFQKLNPENPTAAACGVYQVTTYLYDEAYDKVSDVLGIFVPNTDYDEY